MGSKSALVVDDSKSARFALRRHLEHHAYQVETAESAEEALDLLKRSQPGVIFLDHVMPGIDGFEALQQIRSNPVTGKIPVVICSSNEGEEFTRQARSRGASDVLQKPPSRDRLAQILARLSQTAPPAAAARPAPARAGSNGARARDFSAELAAIKQRLAAAAATPGPAAAAAAPADYQALQRQIVALEQNLLAQLSELSRQVERLIQQQPLQERQLEALVARVAQATAAQLLEHLRADASPRARRAG